MLSSAEPHYYFFNISREMSKQDRRDFTDYMEKLMMCRMDTLPVETLAHPFLYKSEALRTVFKCMEGVRATTALVDCVGNIATFCGGPDPQRRQTSAITRHGSVCVGLYVWVCGGMTVWVSVYDLGLNIIVVQERVYNMVVFITYGS